MKSTETQNTEAQRLIEGLNREKEMTDTEIARTLDVSLSTVNRWKRGIVSPRIYGVRKLRLLADGKKLSQSIQRRYEQSIISIHFEVNPLNLNDEARRKIQAVKTILATLETIAEQK